MRNPHEILLRPILTEKSMWMTESANQYTFEVPIDVNKIEIRQAIAQLWPRIKVLRVNTIRRKGKRRRGRGVAMGRTKETKRAIVTVAQGQTIDLV